MKTRFAFQSLIALALAAVPLINGCTQQNAGTAPAYITTSAPPPVVTQVVPVTTTVVEQPTSSEVSAPAAVAVPSLVISNAPAPIVVTEPMLPANLRISKPLNEVIRLAQSGVDETVILTYVTNSPAIFTLGAEEIVYLNDLGVASSVITAMMQRDQALKYAWGITAPPARTAEVVPITNVEPVAAAPTYVNPPQAVPVQEAQPVYVSDNYFYDTLSPYGSWVEVDGYGRCWRPTVAITSSGWQPYRDRGRWVHTDAGWYWMSDYSWGSVAFHYGRWFSHPRWGWCWWPDNVWGPSWVTWRYDNDNCGWAPLPPRSYCRPGGGFYYRDRAVGVSFDFELSVGAFSFVPWNRFCDPHPYRHYLNRPRSVAIYNQTTVINNVVVGNNNTVINRGIPTDRVRERTRTEVRTVSIREEKTRGAGPRQERFERDGRTLVVNRPAPLSIAVGENPSTTREKNSGRINPTRTSEPVVINPATPPSSSRPGPSDRNDRNERKETRPSRDNENRASGRTVTPNQITPQSPAVVTAPVTPTPPSAPPTPARTEPSTLPGREVRKPEDSVNRSRPNSATVVRIPETTPTPARTPTPIFSKPVVVERPVYTPTRSIEPMPAPDTSATGNNRIGRSNGRDNSVWNPPTAQPQPTAPSYRNPTVRRQDNFAGDNSPQIQNNQPAPSTPAYNRPNVETRREERPSRDSFIERSAPNRPVERNSSATYSAPPRASAPVIVMPPPTVVAPAPRPSYTPPPSAPVAPRIEAPPARVEAPRAEPRSESRSESRSEPGRSQRNR